MNRTINKIIDEQIKRWELRNKEKDTIPQKINVVTISREAGSRGFDLAQKLSEKTGFTLFHNEIVDAMVEISKNSRVLLETLDEKAINVVEDVVLNFMNTHHLWPDEYSRLLFRVIHTVARHGNAIILGRGGNCILSGSNVFKVRIVAPVDVRRDYIQHTKNLNKDDAQKYLVSTDSNRAAFVRRYCNCDISDPSRYDMVLNTGTIPIDKAVKVIECALIESQSVKFFFERQ